MTEVKLSRFYYSTVCFKVGQECCCRIDKKSSSGDVRPQFIETRWKPRNLNRNLGGLFRGLDENLVAIFKLPKLLLVRYFTKIQSSILSDTKACHCRRTVMQMPVEDQKFGIKITTKGKVIRSIMDHMCRVTFMSLHMLNNSGKNPEKSGSEGELR